MAKQESMSADDYYRDYLKQTSKKNRNPSSKIMIVLLSIMVLAGGYYIWQEQHKPKIKTAHEATKHAHAKKEQMTQKVSPIKHVIPPKSSHINKEIRIKKPIELPKKVIEEKVIQPIIRPIIEKKKPTIEKKILQERKEIKDLAQSLRPDISKTQKDSKKIKIDTFNKIVMDTKIQASQEEKRLASKHNALSQELTQILKHTKKEKSTYTTALKEEAKVRVDEMQYVIVKEGDTLFYIAKRIYSDAMKYPIIFDANPDILNDPARISIGQKLRVPKLKVSK